MQSLYYYKVINNRKFKQNISFNGGRSANEGDSLHDLVAQGGSTHGTRNRVLTNLIFFQVVQVALLQLLILISDIFS